MDMYEDKKLYNFIPGTKIDEFGVDHSNFSVRDELEYSYNVAEKKELDSIPQYIVDFVISNEGNKEQMYLDTKGKKTIGYGTNVDDYETFDKINWLKDNRPATGNEKLLAFNEMENFKNQGLFGKNYTAQYYKNNSKNALQIAPEEKERIFRKDLLKNLTKLREIWPNFDDFQIGLQSGLVDMRYNMGSIPREKWPHLYDAIHRNDVFGEDGVLANIHRRDVSEDRNKKVYDIILENATNGIYK